MNEKIKGGGPGEIPEVTVLTMVDEFENAVRKFGAVNACEWFGYPSESEFTADTIRHLRKFREEA
jgi:hypothetical protein